MKKLYCYFFTPVFASLLYSNVCKAQTATLALKVPPAAVTIDGRGQEWGDSLSYYNAEKKLNYTIANDKTNLYLVIKTKDPRLQVAMVGAGVTFSIDAKGRKKSSYTVSFPYVDPAAPPFNANGMLAESAEDKALRVSVTRFKKIAVNGFKDIDDATIVTTNTYNVKAAMAFDENSGVLTFEEAIPLELFHAGDLIKNEWAYNILINGISMRPVAAIAPDAAQPAPIAGKGGKGGGGGSKRASSADPAAVFQNDHTVPPAVDFWGKFSLASVQ